MQRKLSVVTALSLSALAFACSKKPPVVPEIDEPEPPPAQVEEPPPKPPCDAQQPCLAKESQPVTFAENTMSFQPPAGWSYVLTEHGVFTSADNNVASLGFAVVDTPLSPKSKASEILDAIKPLLSDTKVSEMTQAAVKKRLRKAPVVEKADGLSLNTWDIKAKVNEKDGMTLIILSELPSGKRVVGVVALQMDAVKDNGQLAHDAYLSLKQAK